MTFCDPMECSMPCLPVHHELLEVLRLMSIELVMPSIHLVLCCPLLLRPSIYSRSFQISQFFTSGGQSIGVSASASVLPIEYSGLISFRMDWLALLAVQGTLKSLFKHHSLKASIQKKNSKKKIKASILQHSAFFIVQLSRPYMTTGKTIALTRRTFVDKVMSLIFSILYRLVITFLPRSKCLLISWLQSPSAVILDPPKIVCHCFHCFPIYLQ